MNLSYAAADALRPHSPRKDKYVVCKNSKA